MQITDGDRVCAVRTFPALFIPHKGSKTSFTSQDSWGFSKYSSEESKLAHLFLSITPFYDIHNIRPKKQPVGFEKRACLLLYCKAFCPLQYNPKLDHGRIEPHIRLNHDVQWMKQAGLCERLSSALHEMDRHAGKRATHRILQDSRFLQFY